MPYREDEEFQDRKEGKKQRKALQKSDLSKFKKTDLRKKEEVFKKEGNFSRGRVLSILPEEITVETEDRAILGCTLKGSLKKERSRDKNLCVVGDFVLFDEAKSIVHIEKRKSILSRSDPRHKKMRQIMASNIDQVLITVSLVNPPLKPNLIDRYIIASSKGAMQPVIVITKIDLVDDRTFLNEVIFLYRSLGFTILAVSNQTKEGMTELEKIMTAKASVFAGESGVGKSSLINTVTGQNLDTKEVAKKTLRGTHTTVAAKLIALNCGGWCIDTPGIQSFGLWDLQMSDLKEYFHEIDDLSHQCKYPNCTHTHEPQCFIQEAVAKGLVSKLRYESYLELVAEIKKDDFCI